jgi:recombination protein RecA
MPGAVTTRKEALSSAIKNIESAHGRGAIMRLGRSEVQPVESVTTGSVSIDLVLGGRGLPRGRIVEVFGPEGSGKSTFCQMAVGSVQKNGGTAAYIDAEHALDPTYARRLGVDLGALLLSQPDSGEQALDIAEILARSNAVDLVVVDSVAALVPRAVGLQARLMSQAMRKLCAAIHRSKTIAVFINQLREKIGVMFGSPETTPGGRALKFYSSVRMDIRRIGAIKEADRIIGNRIRVKVVKNKVAPPFQTAEVDLIFGKGISHEGELLDLGERSGKVRRTGNTLLFGDQKLGVGRERARQFLGENLKVAQALERTIRGNGTSGGRPAPAPAPATPPAEKTKEVKRKR